LYRLSEDEEMQWQGVPVVNILGMYALVSVSRKDGVLSVVVVVLRQKYVIQLLRVPGFRFLMKKKTNLFPWRCGTSPLGHSGSVIYSLPWKCNSLKGKVGVFKIK